MVKVVFIARTCALRVLQKIICKNFTETFILSALSFREKNIGIFYFIVFRWCVIIRLKHNSSELCIRDFCLEYLVSM